MRADLAQVALLALCALLFPFSAQAFECPKHFDDAQAVIDKVEADMKGMEGQMSKEEHALVHALLDDAKMLLVGAKHNHEKPQGAYDHGRAIAKADAALGYARAADILHFHYMNKQRFDRWSFSQQDSIPDICKQVRQRLLSFALFQVGDHDPPPNFAGHRGGGFGPFRGNR